MQISNLVFLGIIIFLVGVAPVSALVGPAGHQPLLSDPVSSCTEPLDRPTNESIEDPQFIGTVSRFEDNDELVNISYNATTHRENTDLTIFIRSNSSIVNHSSNFEKVNERQLKAQNQSSHYWVVYDPGEAWFETAYPSSKDWVFAPTPEHNSGVSLTPAEEGYIGRYTLFLGNYEVVEYQSGCQQFQVIKPAGEDFDTREKLEVLGASSRLLDFGIHYSTVRIFASPQLDGPLGGFVEDYHNEILLDGTSSVRDPDNVWVHEYVHTLQEGESRNDLSWLNEGAASYFAARVSLELNLISSLEYDHWLAEQTSYNPNKNLSEAKHEEVAYKWGSAILAESAARTYNNNNQYSFTYRYNEVDQYSTSDYEEFESSLEQSNINESYINTTRASVFEGERPIVEQAYRSPLGNHVKWVLEIKETMVGIGIGVFIVGLIEMIKPKLRQYWKMVR